MGIEDKITEFSVILKQKRIHFETPAGVVGLKEIYKQDDPYVFFCDSLILSPIVDLSRRGQFTDEDIKQIAKNSLEVLNLMLMLGHGELDENRVWKFRNGLSIEDMVQFYNQNALTFGIRPLDAVIACQTENQYVLDELNIQDPELMEKLIYPKVLARLLLRPSQRIGPDMVELWVSSPEWHIPKKYTSDLTSTHT